MQTKHVFYCVFLLGKLYRDFHLVLRLACFSPFCFWKGTVDYVDLGVKAICANVHYHSWIGMWKQKLLVMEKTHKGHLRNLMDQMAHTSTKVTWANLARCMNRPKGRIMMLSKVCCLITQQLRMWFLKRTRNVSVSSCCLFLMSIWFSSSSNWLDNSLSDKSTSSPPRLHTRPSWRWKIINHAFIVFSFLNNLIPTS